MRDDQEVDRKLIRLRELRIAETLWRVDPSISPESDRLAVALEDDDTRKHS
mgnify:FL=1